MTNNELYLKFTALNAGNPFDVMAELKTLQKEYKTTPFYKQTKMNCFKAYEYFCKAQIGIIYQDVKNLLNTDYLASKLTNVLESVDQTTIDNFFKTILGQNEIANLQQEKGEAKILLEQLKDVIQ